ncbi:MAG TPA: GNAT family N-acetyltransferase [Mycobacteriales bacterium]|nr:GNAT family N-acetyltransferase [Mycobacteriales bacterium]
MSDFEIRDEAYDSPAAQQLIAAVQGEYVVRYGGPDEAPIDGAEFAPPDGLFLVGYLDNKPVATGGLRRHGDGEVELKRMYVVPEARGKGLSRIMLAELEERARGLGAGRIVLETGNRQPEAVSLYETSGYTRIEGFGFYADAPLSISFEKTL